MHIIGKRLSDLVEENHTYALVLHNFGIKFIPIPKRPLEQVCRERGLNLNQVKRSLESIHQRNTEEISLERCPVDLIIHYLKHSHSRFINQKLPYMARLIEDLDVGQIGDAQLVKDLQIFFPLFVEEFICHIHEEEDSFFSYVITLLRASTGQYNLARLYYDMENHSLQYFLLDHHTHDDEMRGIREITNNYSLPAHPSLHLKVLYSELLSLEGELHAHAQIEDEILFVKALKLENLVKEMLKRRIKLN
ncbi:MAG: iron-sulfur cluster repair di-iron protein [Bacteroidia bacterium]|nr:iron-sulfur cluster repair di-iron protein [Bacteroidia bacterium]